MNIKSKSQIQLVFIMLKLKSNGHVKKYKQVTRRDFSDFVLNDFDDFSVI